MSSAVGRPEHRKMGTRTSHRRYAHAARHLLTHPHPDHAARIYTPPPPPNISCHPTLFVPALDESPSRTPNLLLIIILPLSMTRHLRSARADRAQYAPASEAADISRLLDPSYAKRPHSPSSSTSSTPLAFALPPRVYVDHDGAMHDPDYRPFPAFPSPPARKDSRESNTTTRPVSPLSPPLSATFRRPSWDSYPEVITPTSSQEPEEPQCPPRFFKCRSPRRSSHSSEANPRRPSFEEDYTYDDDEDDDEDPSFPHTPSSDSYSAQPQIELRYIPSSSFLGIVLTSDAVARKRSSIRFKPSRSLFSLASSAPSDAGESVRPQVNRLEWPAQHTQTHPKT